MASPRVVLLMGGAEYHSEAQHRDAFLDRSGSHVALSLQISDTKLSVVIDDSLAALTPAFLAQFDVIANYTTFLEPTVEQVDALITAVEGGKGYVGIHGATATFWNSPRYLNLIGTKFVRHDPYKVFRVEITDPHHPITAGVSSFDVEDELYECEGDFSRLHVLIEAEGHPLAYTRSVGRGRVFYIALGHDQQALRNPNVKRLLRQGILWAAGG
jgi:type 1 glutamine amidotransferase